MMRPPHSCWRARSSWIPKRRDIRLHAATVAAALGDRVNAEKELKEAIRLDPSIDQRAETKPLRERIAALPIKKP